MHGFLKWVNWLILNGQLDTTPERGLHLNNGLLTGLTNCLIYRYNLTYMYRSRLIMGVEKN